MVETSVGRLDWVAPGIKTGPTTRRVDGHHDGDGPAVPVNAFTRLSARVLRGRCPTCSRLDAWKLHGTVGSRTTAGQDLPALTCMFSARLQGLEPRTF